MQRWGIPFDYVEEHWTPDQMVCLTAAIIENSKEEARAMKGGDKRRKTMDQYTAEQELKAKQDAN